MVRFLTFRFQIAWYCRVSVLFLLIVAERGTIGVDGLWGLRITNAFQLAAPGQEVTFNGVVSNLTGAPLLIRDLSLFIEPSGGSTNWAVRMAKDFLATDLTIPPGGYRGAIFSVSVP